MKRIGIDIGKVIIGGSGEEDTSFFADNYLATPEVSGAMESIRKLSEGNEIWLISKCGPKVEARTLEWFLSHSFYEKTLVEPERVLFVRKRPQKAPLAAKLQLDVFIDDRVDIIETMVGIVEQPVLFTSWEKALQELHYSGVC